jgi:DNA replication protein DnaC
MMTSAIAFQRAFGDNLAARLSALTAQANQCPACDGAGFVRAEGLDVTDVGFGRVQVCSECQPLRSQQAALNRWLHDMPRLTRHSALFTSPALRNLSFEAFDATVCESVTQTYNSVVQWVQRDAPPLLYVWGAPGNGKTHLAAAASLYLHSHGQPYLFILGSELVGWLRASIRDHAVEEIVALCCDVPWLLIDELEVANWSDWTSHIWFRLINARYTGGRPTLFVSNQNPADCIDDGRVVSRLGDSSVCTIIHNAGADYRQRK